MSSPLPGRQTTSRAHSHSVSLGTLNSTHRVNRRKSSTSIIPTAVANIAAAAKDAAHDPARQAKFNAQVDGLGISANGASLVPAGAAADFSKSPNLSAQVTTEGASALVDGPMLASLAGAAKGGNKARARRASEGSRQIKERSRSNTGELKCETCGKGYKHGSCLTKHLWEHTPEWSLTSKLLISKHQQVQLLEAASVLVSMTSESSPQVPTANAVGQEGSDLSSQSPARSGASDPMMDDYNSSRTSTPSQDDSDSSKGRSYVPQPRRQDSYSSAYSRSYQSTFASSFAPSSGPSESGLHFNRTSGSNSRPSTAPGGGGSIAEEQADITAAAEGLLSCSLSTPQHLPVQVDSDIPPVPPLPARFAKMYGESPRLQPQHPSDVEMNYEDRRHMDDDEEGVFGRMDQ